MNEMTYGQVFGRFIAKYPDIEVEDYRPASGLVYELFIWSKNPDAASVVQYQPTLDDFLFIDTKLR